MSLDLADSSRKILQDAYVEFLPGSNWSIRAGQMLLPQGFEGQEDIHARRFVDYSPVNIWVIPYDHRDIGFSASADFGTVAAAAAVFNGSGRNTLLDENKWKDMSGRLLVRPFRLVDLELAARGYYGRLGADGLTFWNVGLESRYRVGGLEATTEMQNAQGRTPKRSLYVMASYAWGELLEPAVRFDMEDLTAGHLGLGFSGGVGFYPLGPSVKLMLNTRYWRWFSPVSADRWTEQKFTVSAWGRL